jgi:aspartyl-tRNA(Asn)/glutamyl-tRNA(Gln) amidotransferase subunit C
MLPACRLCSGAAAVISPTFYLIIPVRLAAGNSKKTPELLRICRIPTLNRQAFVVLNTYLAARRRASPAMSLDQADVQRLSILAQLELDPGQTAATLDKLNSIFNLVEAMKAVDTSGVEPLNHPVAAFASPQQLALRLRDDAVTEINRREDYQKPAPAVQDGLYLVPKVIE